MKKIPPINCKCSNCGIDIQKNQREFKKSSNHFCGSSCSASFNNKSRESIWTPERKQKLSEWAKQHSYRPSREEIRKNKHIASTEELTRRCAGCKQNFLVKYISSKKKYCSQKCIKQYAIIGGYRENSTKLHRCIYKGISMHSGSEKKFAEILDKNGISWIKNSNQFYKYIFNNKNKKYYPDFYLPDFKLWVEIKGKIYVEPWLPNKIQSVKDAGERIIMIFSKELKEDYILKLIGGATDIQNPPSTLTGLCASHYTIAP